MDVFDAIFTRRSYRRFKWMPVPNEVLYKLVEAGMKAPSAGNLQDFTFIVTKDRDTINKLPEMCMEQTWISSAQAVIVVCSQPDILADWYGEKGRHVFSIQNAAAATQNILLAAHASGLGACWVGGFDQEEVDKLFRAEGKARVETIIPIGYPGESLCPKNEKDLKLMLHFDTYGNTTRDKAMVNRDYSVKMEQHAKALDRKSKSLFERLSSFMDRLGKSSKNSSLKNKHEDKEKQDSESEKKSDEEKE